MHCIQLKLLLFDFQYQTFSCSLTTSKLKVTHEKLSHFLNAVKVCLATCEHFEFCKTSFIIQTFDNECRSFQKCVFYEVDIQNFKIIQIIYRLVSFQLQSILTKLNFTRKLYEII